MLQTQRLLELQPFLSGENLWKLHHGIGFAGTGTFVDKNADFRVHAAEEEGIDKIRHAAVDYKVSEEHFEHVLNLDLPRLQDVVHRTHGDVVRVVPRFEQIQNAHVLVVHDPDAA